MALIALILKKVDWCVTMATRQVVSFGKGTFYKEPGYNFGLRISKLNLNTYLKVTLDLRFLDR